MSDLNYTLKQLCDRNRDGSHATLQASGSAWGAIREAFLRIVMHAGPKAAIDGYTRRHRYSPQAHWISYP